MTWDSLSARSRRWLTMGGIAAAVLLGSWAIAAGLSSDSGRSRRAVINEAILTDADTRQTTIDRLAAQLDSSRAENEALSRKIEELAERQLRLPDTIASQLQRGLDRDSAAQDRVLDGRLQQLEVQLERLGKLVETKDERHGREANRPKPADESDRTTARGAEDAVQVQVGRAFGTAEAPDCRGLTSAEIQSFQWSTLDLDQWITILGTADRYPDPDKLTPEGLTGTGNFLDRVNPTEPRPDVITRTHQRLDSIDVEQVRRRGGDELEELRK